mgnify:FL=1
MQKEINEAPTNICPACGAGFTCGMQAGQPECWCAAFPPLLAVPSAGAGSCYCPACLARMIETQQGGPKI